MQRTKKRYRGRATLAQAISEFAAERRLRGFKYTPPISAIEQELADTLSRYSHVKWHQQAEFQTGFANFYLDMGCRVRSDRAIGIECDGDEYHQDGLRDFCRDALMLGKGLSCIYRIEAWAIRRRPFDWLRLLSELEPNLFTDDCAESIRALGQGYDALNGRGLRNARRFLTCRHPEMVPVRKVLELAQSHKGISFPAFVECVRRSEVVCNAA